ncbi:MAG: SIMPL domain-containing protein [Firmicutes bacterium]|nr:SIMPL domain-containing protein [Bacillota bacterium]
MKKPIAIALFLCLLASPAFAMAANTLRTEGTATLSVVPDQAILAVGCAVENAEASAAQRQVGEAIASVTEVARQMGIEEADISTASFNIYPVYNYSESESMVRGYRVEHMLTIAVKDLDTLGDVMNAVLKAGANQAYGITFACSREKDVYLQAMALAVANAAAKADALAIASGVWLGALEQINEMPNTNNYPTQARAQKAEMADAGSIGGSIMKGEMMITATVELVYAIR